MAEMRIFSYLPNPRLWKATIAARLCGVEVEIRGAKPAELKDWLWDFDARPLSEVDRAAEVPAATEGRVGFKEVCWSRPRRSSKRTLRYGPGRLQRRRQGRHLRDRTASCGRSRGWGPSNASSMAVIPTRHHASTVSSTPAWSLRADSQIYLLALREPDFPAHVHARAAEAFAIYLAGIDQALKPARTFWWAIRSAWQTSASLPKSASSRTNACGTRACIERGLAPVLSKDWPSQFPRAAAHPERLALHPALSPDVGPYLSKLNGREK